MQNTNYLQFSFNFQRPSAKTAHPNDMLITCGRQQLCKRSTHRQVLKRWSGKQQPVGQQCSSTKSFLSISLCIFFHLFFLFVLQICLVVPPAVARIMMNACITRFLQIL
uniref:Uncharacterized protein n=1 Tax=Ceratitis capitata TaxID=7213 RepID=W8BZB9_CERCA